MSPINSEPGTSTSSIAATVDLCLEVSVITLLLHKTLFNRDSIFQDLSLQFFIILCKISFSHSLWTNQPQRNSSGTSQFFTVTGTEIREPIRFLQDCYSSSSSCVAAASSKKKLISERKFQNMLSLSLSLFRITNNTSEREQHKTTKKHQKNTL